MGRKEGRRIIEEEAKLHQTKESKLLRVTATSATAKDDFLPYLGTPFYSHREQVCKTLPLGSSNDIAQEAGGIS